jgi:hypothetical protein
VLKTMKQDPSSASFAYQRMRELTENMFLADAELQITTLVQENAILRAQSEINQDIMKEVDLKTSESLKKSAKKKDHYKVKLQDTVGTL